MRLHHRLASNLGRIRRDPADPIDEQAINDACRQENDHGQERFLKPSGDDLGEPSMP
jgi:hypothetical protein